MPAEQSDFSATLDRGIDFGAVYEEHFRLLVGTAMGHFSICEMDAQTLVHEVFLSYLSKADEVFDARAWLLSAICNASKHYLRIRARHVALPTDFVDMPDPRFSRVGDALTDQLAAREAFRCLTPRCQLALRLRYLEGYSVPEIADELDTSTKYAQKLVSRCLRQAQTRYVAKGKS